MQGLSLTNFKSYSKHDIFGFNPNINIIIGSNGQGKSNLFKAFSFALSDRLQINRTQFNNYIHRGIDVSNDDNIEVEVVIKQKDGKDELAKIGKVWKNNLNQQCFVNSKATSKKQFQNFVQSLGLSYTNPYNMIQQGKINQITLMDEFELYKLLEEVTGARKFNKRKEEAQAILKKVQIQKQQAKTVLRELDEKLRSLENKKQQFQFFAVEEKTKKYRMKKHFTQLLDSTKHNLEKIKNEYDTLTESLDKVILKKKYIFDEIEEGTMFIKTAKEKIALVEKPGAAPLQTQILQTQDFQQFEKKQKQINKQLKGYAKEMKEKDKFMAQFKKQFVLLEEKYQAMKINKELNNPNEGKDKIITAFQSEIKNQEKNLKDLEDEKASLNKKIQDGEKFLKNKKNSQNEKQYDKLKQQINENKLKIQQNKKQIAQMSWHKNLLTIQCDSLKQMVNQTQLKLKKSLPFLDFNLLQYCRNKKIDGVYGYLIEFVKIDENVSFAYEIAGIGKLCSLLVEDQQACMAVIDINRKLKGRQINIIQLDYIRNQPVQSQSAPKSDNVKKLNNPKWIKINMAVTQMYPKKLADDVEKIIKNTFGKYALVKDYETGLKISKQYHINCITGDRQIVYSEGYHCKLGQENFHHENNIQSFFKFDEKRQTYRKKLIEKEQAQQKLLNAENEQIHILNNHQKLQTQFNKLSASVNQIKTERKLLDNYLKNVDQIAKKYSDCQALIIKKKETIKSINSKNNSKTKQNKMSKVQCEKIQNQYHNKRRQFNIMLMQIYQIQQIMQKLTLQKEDIDNKILNSRNNKVAGVFDPKLMINQTEKQLEQKQINIQKLQNDLQSLNKLQKQLQHDKNHVEIKLITYRAEQQDLLNRLSQIGQTQQNEEEMEELSNSMSVSMQGRKKVHHFSAKDKLLFNKFANILQSFASTKKTFIDLEQAQQKIRHTMDKFEKDSQEHISHMAQKFEKQFVDIFTFIVNQGNAQVRLKKVSQKIKDTIRYKNCLMVRVSFSSSAETMKKWNDFSGGQKTVIAISMILALQRCQPAPFYVLDQIDSALDSVFVQKIVQLLARQTQRSKCQYFISSFKQDMMSFPQQLANYYLVTNQNRVSHLQRISRNRAVQAIRSIVMRK